MKLSIQSIITPEKLTNYLLKWQPENDKSRFLESAGYTQSNWKRLESDLRNQILSLDAELLRKTYYGDMYKIKGELTGPKGISLKTITIWMVEYKTKQTKFITLYPDKET
ncbi:MAG: DUF6883 domain-containing protein [Pseudomonadota bacterium]